MTDISIQYKYNNKQYCYYTSIFKCTAHTFEAIFMHYEYMYWTLLLVFFIGNGNNVVFLPRDGSSFSLSDQMHFVKVLAIDETLVQPLASLFDVGSYAYLPPLELGTFNSAIGRPLSEQRACSLMFFTHSQTAQPHAPLHRYLATC